MIGMRGAPGLMWIVADFRPLLMAREQFHRRGYIQDPRFRESRLVTPQEIGRQSHWTLAGVLECPQSSQETLLMPNNTGLTPSVQIVGWAHTDDA